MALGALKISNLTLEVDKKEKNDDLIERILKGKHKSSKKRDPENWKETVLEGANLEIKPSENIMLLADNEESVYNFVFALMGELKLKQGNIKARGKVLFGDSEHTNFISGESIRENIIMGEHFYPEIYSKILNIVELNISKYKGRDMTEMIEGGLNLSTNERRKISLARMMYHSADIYILKDYFGHGEYQMDEILFRRAIGSYMKKRTVVVVSKAENIARLSNKIVVLKDHKLTVFNGIEDFKGRASLDMKAMLQRRKGGALDRVVSVTKAKNSRWREFIIEKQIGKLARAIKGFQFNTLGQNGKALLNSTKKEEGAAILNILAGGIKKAVENRTSGKSVKEFDESEIYKNLTGLIYRYLFSKGCFRVIIFFMLYLTSISLFIAADIWTGIWSTKRYDLDTFGYISIFFGIALVAAIFAVFRDVLFIRMIIQTSRTLHDHVMNLLLHMELIWLNEHPNANPDYKMSYELRTVDNSVNDRIQASMSSLSFCIGGLILLNYVYIGGMFVVTVLLVWYVFGVCRKYIRTTKNFIRFMVEESANLQGIYHTMVSDGYKYRLMHKQSFLDHKFYKNTDELQRAMTHFNFFSRRWLGIRLSIANAALMFINYFFPILFIIILKDWITLSSLQVALSLTWSLRIMSHFNALVRFNVDLHLDIVSYGRLKVFAEKVKTEPKVTIKEVKERGGINTSSPILELENVDLTLSKERILQGISLTIQPKIATAIVGSIGAGKH